MVGINRIHKHLLKTCIKYEKILFFSSVYKNNFAKLQTNTLRIVKKKKLHYKYRKGDIRKREDNKNKHDPKLIKNAVQQNFFLGERRGLKPQTMLFNILHALGASSMKHQLRCLTDEALVKAV